MVFICTQEIVLNVHQRLVILAWDKYSRSQNVSICQPKDWKQNDPHVPQRQSMSWVFFCTLPVFQESLVILPFQISVSSISQPSRLFVLMFHNHSIPLRSTWVVLTFYGWSIKDTILWHIRSAAWCASTCIAGSWMNALDGLFIMPPGTLQTCRCRQVNSPGTDAVLKVQKVHTSRVWLFFTSMEPTNPPKLGLILMCW